MAPGLVEVITAIRTSLEFQEFLRRKQRSERKPGGNVVLLWRPDPSGASPHLT